MADQNLTAAEDQALAHLRALLAAGDRDAAERFVIETSHVSDEDLAADRESVEIAPGLWAPSPQMKRSIAGRNAQLAETADAGHRYPRRPCNRFKIRRSSENRAARRGRK